MPTKVGEIVIFHDVDQVKTLLKYDNLLLVYISIFKLTFHFSEDKTPTL